ncbi:MAG: EthD domain-containing protein [bacterium]|nr:EthD domain-containing protein [bacterium]
MFRITEFFKRRDDLDRPEAVERWREDYFAAASALMRAAGAKRAIANLPFDPPAPGQADIFDAVAEYWFADAATARDGLDRLVTDRPAVWQNIAAPDAPPPWIGEVRPVLDAGALGIKVIRAGRPAQGVDATAALAYWRDHHPTVAQTAPAFWALLRRYTQVPALDPENPSAYPLQADVGAATPADMAAAFSHPEYFSIVQPDERKFSLAGKLVSERLAFAAAREVVAYDDR